MRNMSIDLIMLDKQRNKLIELLPPDDTYLIGLVNLLDNISDALHEDEEAHIYKHKWS